MERTENLKQYWAEYRQKLNDLFDQVNIDDVSKVLTTMIEAWKQRHTVYVCGNGGSAATASHMQVDFRYFIRHFSKFHPSIVSITDHAPMMTAIGNDTDFLDVFKDQLKGNIHDGDVLICISASGNSMNLVRAAQYAKTCGATTIAYVGFLGGPLKEVCDLSLYTPNPIGDYGPIEDLHMMYNHLMVNYLGKDEEFLTLEEKYGYPTD